MDIWCNGQKMDTTVRLCLNVAESLDLKFKEQMIYLFHEKVSPCYQILDFDWFPGLVLV